MYPYGCSTSSYKLDNICTEYETLVSREIVVDGKTRLKSHLSTNSVSLWNKVKALTSYNGTNNLC